MIISAISKIHFAIISVLSFIFLILFTSFILLQNGIYINDISLQKVKVKQLYIKWDEKINVVVKELNIIEEKRGDSSDIEYKNIIKTIKQILPFVSWFKKIIIEKIYFNKIVGTLKYIEDEKGTLQVATSDFTLKSSLYKSQNILDISIDEFKNRSKNIDIDGHIIFDTHRDLELIALLNIELINNSKLNIYAHSDIKQLSYKIEADRDISSIKNIINMLDINPKIRYWVDDAIEMSSLSLRELYGWAEYENIDKAYLNLYARAVANNLNYTYNEKLAPIISQATDLEFKDGILYIRPQNAYSYNFFLDKSWLKIDFSKKDELLTLYLLFKGQVNSDILYLLNNYKIKLPFTQTKGNVNTNLKLDINLQTLDVTAIGDFKVKESQINYLDLDIDIVDARVFLNNSDIKINNMFAKYADIATSYVDLDFNARESKGKLVFNVEDINLQDSNLTLVKNKKILKATYAISPKGDLLNIDKSTWKYREKILNVESIQIPFDIKTLRAKIPQTLIEVPKLAAASISGDIFFNLKEADLNLNILKFNYNDIEFNKPNSLLKIKYKDNLTTVLSNKPIDLLLNNKNLTVDNLYATFSSSLFKTENLYINFDNIIKSKISSEYNLTSSTGRITLHNIEVKEKNVDEFFKNNKNIKLDIKNKKNKTSISSKDYDFEYIFNDDEWSLTFNSINKITPYSKILKQYSLTNGYFKLQKQENQKKFNFSLNSDYKYKFLATKTDPIKNYSINGEFDNLTNHIHFKINDSVDVDVKENIEIKADNTGINIHEILRFFADNNGTNKSKKSPDIFFDAKDSYIYLGKNRRIISDTINLKYIDDSLSAKLIHKKGSAFFELNNDILHLYGDKFNDEFMDKLFANSKFKNGSLEFYINGSVNEYGGVIYAKDTTILDYKILNNILAFVNTVPSLVTFSLPGYNKNGIAAKSAYIKFNFKDNMYNISDIYLKSKEIDIAGFGEASVERNSINLDLNLKTDLGSSISKIPLIGHILLGKESVSTTLKITGALDNPDVNTQIAKDIAVAPFNIIKRTLMYPFEIFKDDKKKSE